MFRQYARSIHRKAVPADPNFLRISVACGKIEQWCEHHYPSFVTIGKGLTPAQQYSAGDARTRIALAEQKLEKEMSPLDSAANARSYNQESSSWELIGYLAGAFLLISGLCLAIVYGVLYFFGDA